MQTMTASDVKQHFGACLEAAQVEPMIIEKNGRPSAVILSIHEFNRLQSLEDEKWGELANKASEKGFLSKKSFEKWFDKMQGRLKDVGT